MISDFQSFLESTHYSEQQLLFVFFKSESSSASTQKPVPNSETDVVFENYHLVNKSLSFDDVIKKPEQLNLDWNFVAVSLTAPNSSENEIKDHLADIRKSLLSGSRVYLIFDREGFSISPSKIE